MGTIPFDVPHGSVPSTAGSLARANLALPEPRDAGNATLAAGQQVIAAGNTTIAAQRTLAESGRQLADFGAQFTDQYIRAKMEVASSDWTSDLSKKLTQAEFEASKIPDRDQATAAYDAKASKIYDDFASSDVHPLIRANVTSKFTNESTLRRSSTQRQAFDLESQTQRGKLATDLDGYMKSAANAQDPRLVEQQTQMGLDAIDGRVAGGWMNPEAGAKAKLEFKSGVYRTKIELAMAQDPRLGVALFGATKGNLSAQDAEHLGRQVEDQKGNISADGFVDKNLPVFGSGLDNNVGNITRSGALYSGGKGPGSGAFETFATPEHGVAASYGLIKTKAAQNGGAISFTDLIGGNSKVGGWAPADNGRDPMLKGNQPGPYATRLAKSVGLSAGDNVPVGDMDKMSTILKEMNGHEKGKQTVPDAAFSRGIKLAQGDTSMVGAPGDAVTDYAIQGQKLKMQVLADDSIPDKDKSRIIAKIDQRTSATVGLASAQRKQLDDQSEAYGVQLYRGQNKPGTFAMLADGYRKSGDNGKADAMQILADNESVFSDWMSLPRGDLKFLAQMMGGKAAAIFGDYLTDQRAGAKEARETAVAAHKSFSESVQGGAEPSTLVAPVKEAVDNYLKAGDRIKAQQVIKEFDATVKAHDVLAGTPPQVAAAVTELRQQVESAGGADARQAQMLQLVTKFQNQRDEAWKNDPLTANRKQTGPLDAYQPGMSGVALQEWANKRSGQAAQTEAVYGQPVAMFTKPEIDDILGRLAKAPVQVVQQQLATMATAIPAEQVARVAQKIAGNHPMGDAWATAMAFYKRGQPGDSAIADSLIAGANLWQQGGPEGKEKVKFNEATLSVINAQLGEARYGLDDRTNGNAVTTQNNAIIARYIFLRGAEAGSDQGVADTRTLNKAISDIVGTPTKKNGGSFLLPTGVERYQFDDAVGSMTQGDLPQDLAPAGDGTPVTLGMIKNQATFQSSGDGRYRVWIKDPKADRQVPIRTLDGRFYELDIRPLVARGASLPPPPPGAMGRGVP